MVVVKLALTYDPQWRQHVRTKGNWRNRRFWFQRRATWTTGQYMLGPFRLDVNLPDVPKAPRRPNRLTRRLVGK